MSATGQITVSNVSQTAVKALSVCKTIWVTENRGVAGWPNGDYLVFKGAVTNSSNRIQGGARYPFTKVQGTYQPGETVGWLQMVNAISTTFDQDEDDMGIGGTR